MQPRVEGGNGMLVPFIVVKKKVEIQNPRIVLYTGVLVDEKTGHRIWLFFRPFRRLNQSIFMMIFLNDEIGVVAMPRSLAIHCLQCSLLTQTVSRIVRIGVVMVLTGLVYLAHMGYKGLSVEIRPYLNASLLYLVSFGMMSAGLFLHRRFVW